MAHIRPLKLKFVHWEVTRLMASWRQTQLIHITKYYWCSTIAAPYVCVLAVQVLHFLVFTVQEVTVGFVMSVCLLILTVQCNYSWMDLHENIFVNFYWNLLMHCSFGWSQSTVMEILHVELCLFMTMLVTDVDVVSLATFISIHTTVANISWLLWLSECSVSLCGVSTL